MASDLHVKQWQSSDPVREIAPEDLQSPDLRALLALWNEKRGDLPWPAHAALTPRDMKAYLRYLHVYDVLDGGNDFKIRLFGTGMVTPLGADLTGTLVSAFPNATIGQRIAQSCRTVLTGGKPLCEGTAHSMDSSELQIARLEMIWLPLGPPERVEQILGCTIIKVEMH